ncbi:MAG: LysR substrate-binding domain-containing protein [Pseudomonadota bacterium]
MPTLQQLRYLVAIADQRHFRRAAEACHVTQPTLSAQLKELEAKLGADLVERTRQAVILTPVGRVVVEHARRALTEVAEIRSVSTAMRARFSTTIKAGVVQSLGSYFLPLVLPELHDAHPKLGLFIRESDPETLLRELEAGELDLLFLPMPLRRNDFESISLFREPIVVVAPHEHALAGVDEVDPEMLRGETVLSLHPGNQLWEQVRQLCEDWGARLAREYEGANLDVVRQMVAMGMGVSLMPALYVRSEVAHQSMVEARSFRRSPPSITIGMVWRRGTVRSDEFGELANFLGKTLRRHAPEITVFT